MTVKLWFSHGDSEDYMVVSGDLETIREMAKKEVERRKPDDYWSEVVSED